VLTAAAADAQPPRFEAVQPELFGAGGTLVNAWADADGDVDPDLFVGFNGEPNRLYRNDGGAFTDVAAAAGLAVARPTRAAAWGDADGDGDADLLVGFAPGDGPVLRLYRNDAGRFSDATAAAGIAVDSGAVRQLVWIDHDDDGDVDLFVAFRDRANALFHNDAGRFTDIAAEIGLADTRRSVGAVWFDADEDGDVDLVVGNMDGDANGFFRNDGGRFADVAWGGRARADSTNGTVRPCAADVDGDGHIDLFFANYGRNGLFLNRGGGEFEDVSRAWRIDVDARYDACAFADADHDGRLDLYVNGTVTGGVSYDDYLFLGREGAFEDVTPPELKVEADHGAQWADFDGDGDIDLALTGARATGTHALLRNTMPERRGRSSLLVRVVDEEGRPTRAGSEVRIYAAGTEKLLGTRLVDAGSGYNAQSVLPVHFGLAAPVKVDVEVTVSGSGRRRITRVGNVDVLSQRGPLEVRVGR
jgi:hypothetical protein